MSFKTTDGLMRHLRTKGISISGSREKSKLINTGYFHGYKGYRFFVNASHPIPFASYHDIYATIQFDSDLKALFYPKMMFIETAIKNIALECILTKANSEQLSVIYDKVLASYHNAPAGSNPNQKRNYQKNKLRIQEMIQRSIVREYNRENPVITHFYDNVGHGSVPIWAVFEILTMGDFGCLLSGLDIQTRASISQTLGINQTFDSNFELVHRYIYSLKDLRNAIAHNAVIFDTRFRSFDARNSMKSCLKAEFGLPYVNFKSIDDYIGLVCYFLKLLSVPKTEMKAFVREYQRITRNYKNSVDSAVAAVVIHPDSAQKMNCIINSL